MTKTRWFLAGIRCRCDADVCWWATHFAGRHDHQWIREHPTFDEHERVVVNGGGASITAGRILGFRVEDRLPRDWEPRLQVGFVLDSGWRGRMPVPVELYRRLPPPPPHFAYYVIGGHVVPVGPAQLARSGRDSH